MNITPRVLLLSALLLAAACEQHHLFTANGMDAGSTPATCTTDKARTFTRPVDLLFVVDNSGSMREEQEALRAQIPRLLRAFASGDLNDDGIAEHPAITDMHVGVISTDMGVPGVPGADALGCGDAVHPYGDNAALLIRPDPGVSDCSATPTSAPFIRWQREDTDADAGDKDLASLAQSVSCLASLGTTGCGYEQHLEASLKALWPSDDRIQDTQMELDPPFHDGTHGQGAPDGANAGFLRNAPGNESIVLVVLLTDENDCSSWNLQHFTPDNYLSPTDPLHGVGLNLRCMQSPQNLFAVSRYVDGLKALRPGREDSVLFAAIAGVPVDLIDRTVDLNDAAALDRYYDAMLDDSRMQEVPDPVSLTVNPNLIPSCHRQTTDPLTGAIVDQKAYPPRRLVEVARAFGRNGVIESICQADFAPVADALLKRVFDVLERSSCVGE